MTDLEKPLETPRSKAARSKKKPATQTAGVSGIDGHGGMGEAPVINWPHLMKLPSFEMFVLEESGHNVGAAAVEWVNTRRQTMGDNKLHDLYSKWHKKKGLWPNETPDGEVIQDEAL